VPDKSDLPQGTLDLLILQVVAAGAIHGYAIAQRLQLISRDVVQVPQGSLYPALHRLENRGLLTAEWKPSDSGRESKFYRLTRRRSGCRYFTPAGRVRELCQPRRPGWLRQ
jgi:PadR family transcriptional regulator PadR